MKHLKMFLIQFYRVLVGRCIYCAGPLGEFEILYDQKYHVNCARGHGWYEHANSPQEEK